MAALQTASFSGAPEQALAGPNRPQRRKREELEALAAEFVNSQIHPLPPAAPARMPKPALAAGGVVLLAVVAWLLWPSGESAPVREQAPAVNEAEAWAKRLEAARERKRQELQRSREFLAKMAAADTALVEDLTARAQNLVARPEASPAPASQVQREAAPEPTPKGSATSAAPARDQAPAPAPAANAEVRPESKEAPVAAAKCSIHVSELSSSGKLTYADVARMKGARVDEGSGHVFTPAVKVATGRSVVLEVMPNGCVRLARGVGRPG